MRKLTLVFAAIALQAPLWLGAAPSAQARTPFDGQWSVSIVTDAGKPATALTAMRSNQSTAYHL